MSSITVTYDGIRELSAIARPTFDRALAFERYCVSLQNATSHVPAARFEPRNIHKLAPFIVLFGVEDGGRDYMVRLIGTRLAEFIGSDPTGRRVSQALSGDEFGSRSRYILDQALALKRPILNQPGRTRLRDKDYMLLESVTYPLVDRDEVVVKVVTLMDFRAEKEGGDA